jgi:hypothetical protein
MDLELFFLPPNQLFGVFPGRRQRMLPGVPRGRAGDFAGIAGIKHPKLFIFRKKYRVLPKSYPPYPQTTWA